MTHEQAYKILEISQTANTEQIKQAYKKQAKKYHPDLYKGDKKVAEEKMKQINEAYAILSKPRSSTYHGSSYDSTMTQEKARKMYEEAEKAQKEFEEQWRKIHEELERMQKEIEEQNRKMRKILKRLLIYLFCTLEFYIVFLLVTTVKSIFYYFNEEMWFFFAYFILLGIIALAAVILTPFGFRWLLKRTGITKGAVKKVKIK